MCFCRKERTKLFLYGGDDWFDLNHKNPQLVLWILYAIFPGMQRLFFDMSCIIKELDESGLCSFVLWKFSDTNLVRCTVCLNLINSKHIEELLRYYCHLYFLDNLCTNDILFRRILSSYMKQLSIWLDLNFAVADIWSIEFSSRIIDREPSVLYRILLYCKSSVHEYYIV